MLSSILNPVRYRTYVLGVLTAVYTLNAADQGLISLLVEPIKRDLALSDTQVGFMTGIAFGLFYATLGIPLARWADRGNRVTITSLAIGAWGGAVMLCLSVATFAQLLLARVAAAVGEAGCMPATYSLLGDYFPAPAARTRAMSIYMLASPLSVLLSFGAGGWLNERFGWRATFFLMGIPGLLIAVLVRLTIREPRQGTVTSTLEAFSWRTVAVLLWRSRSLRHLTAALVLLFTLGLGLGPWYAAFMIRTYGVGTSELGLYLGLIFGAGGAVGVATGGLLADRYFAGDEPGQMRLTAISVALILPCLLAFVFASTEQRALIALVPTVLVCNIFFGPTFALLQRLVGAQLRATAMAVVMLLANLIGMGVGPQLVGTVSDLLQPYLGADSLRAGMLLMACASLWSAYHFAQVAQSVRTDLLSAVSTP